ncbi:MAG TPA: rhamnogalacturonan acetylesterase [Flavisolibacter sp.]|jgi:lysophospholipase L1-like esterase|nr:rhamnogalacturonan acetylesterase [Flavisolibacter sp.]
MKKNLFLFFIFLMATAFQSSKEKTTVYLIGDSTISIKETKAFPETGWGMPFAHFFDSTVVVDNRAKNGRSTRTFIEEGLWAPVMEKLKQGDYVFIQFGHNDEVQTKKSATTEAQFTANLTRYIADTRAKGASPVLLTPAARRKFNATGKIEGTHDVYAALVRNVAKKNNVPLIDLDLKSQQLIQSFGVDGSKMLFNHLQPGEHPNYPEGKTDDTHFSELGARKMAQIVLAEIKSLQLPLAAHIYQPPVKK